MNAKGTTNIEKLTSQIGDNGTAYLPFKTILAAHKFSLF